MREGQWEGTELMEQEARAGREWVGGEGRPRSGRHQAAASRFAEVSDSFSRFLALNLCVFGVVAFGRHWSVFLSWQRC